MVEKRWMGVGSICPGNIWAKNWPKSREREPQEEGIETVESLRQEAA